MNTYRIRTGWLSFLVALVACCLPAAIANANLLTNPGFESGVVNGSLSNVVAWTGGASYADAGEIVNNASLAHGGSHFLKMNAYGPVNRYINQQVPISNPGAVYQVRGWMKTPAGADQFMADNAYVQFSIYYYNAASSPLGSVTSPRMNVTKDSMTNWTEYVSQPVTTPANTAFVRAQIQYVRGKSPYDTNTSGVIYVDDVVLEEVSIPTSGAIKNPGFELMPLDVGMGAYWDVYGNAFGVTTGFVRGGQTALQIWWKENLVGQDFPAVPGYRYEVSGYVANPTGGFEFISENAFATLILAYLDADGNQLASTTSEFFTPESPKNEWMYLKATAVAPIGTVTARVFCAVLKGEGPAEGDFAGSLFFDDISQRLVSTGNSTSGLLHNPGFEDGPTGNAYDLDAVGELMNWTWLGGDEAGFVVDAHAQAGDQSLVIVWPNNLAAQEFVAQAGMSYIVDGYIYTPTVGGLTDTTAFATILLEFFNPDGAAVTASVSVVDAGMITSTSEKGVWHHLCVTNRAPWTGPVTGRVSCAFLDVEANHSAAEIYFDSLTVTATNISVAANTQSGALWNPGFEYTAPGTKLAYIDNWYDLGLDGSVDATFQRTGGNALKLTYTETLLAQDWAATAGYKYETAGYVSSSPTSPFTGSTNAMAIVLLQYLDASGTNVLATYPSALYQPTNGAAPYTPGEWTLLSTRGVAPIGTVYGRTVCALVGNDDAFGGAVWFDDLSQGLVSTGGSSSGLLLNPGFEDNITGNAYDLDEAGELRHWTWGGGDNAGFIVKDYAQAGDQSLVLTWPANYMLQDFEADPAEQYVISGYMFTPSGADKFISDGSSYGYIMVAFYIDGSADPVVENIYMTEHFTGSSPADEWVYFCVTSTVPEPVDPLSVVVGRVACTIYSDDPDADLMLGGIICYDSLSVVKVGGTPGNLFEQWQTYWFGSTSALNGGLHDDFDGDLSDNWDEFIAGTDPTSETAFLGMNSTRIPGQKLVIQWPSTSGRYYRILGTENKSLTGFQVIAPNIPATVPVNVYTSSLPASVSTYYYRLEVSTNAFQ